MSKQGLTPKMHISPRHRTAAWLRIDLRDEEDVDAIIVIPAFGPDHHAGMDCWCYPRLDEPQLIVHNERH